MTEATHAAAAGGGTLDRRGRALGVGPIAGWTAPGNLTVVLPAFNEATALPRLLRRMAAVGGPGLRVIVVDDGSSDGTAAAAAAWRDRLPQLTVLRHERNRGLGAALLTGWAAAVAQLPADGIVVTMDADDTHDPGLLPVLVGLIAAGSDVAIASRFAPGGHEIGLSLPRRAMSVGARVVLGMLRAVPGVRDYTCGYRAYRAGLLARALQVYGPEGLCTTSGFACTAEVLLKLAGLGARCAEAPLVLHYEQKAGRSKMRVGATLLGYARLLAATRRQRGLA